MPLKSRLERLRTALQTQRPWALVQRWLYPWRRDLHLARLQVADKGRLALWHAWRAVRSHRPPDLRYLDWTYIGDLSSWEREGRSLTLRCANASLRLTVFAPDLIQVRLSHAIVDGDGVHTQWEVLQRLRAWGFPTTPDARHFADFESVIAYVHEWMGRRDTLNYEADGVVIKINDLDLAASLGVAGRDPRGAIAFKFEAREATTRLVGVEVQVGSAGTLTPVATLEPVQIGGVQVVHASLHNFQDIARKDIRIGDRVIVRRAGDVIPYVVGPIPSLRTGHEKPIQVPKRCPSCGGPVIQRSDEVAVYCANVNCPAILERRLAVFAGRGAMDIEGLGEKVAQQLVQSGLVKDLSDVYSLRQEDLLGLEGFASRRAQKLLQAIEASKERPLWRLLVGLGIRHVGRHTAEVLSRRFRSMDGLRKASLEELADTPEIGPVIAAFVLVAIPELLRFVAEWRLVLYGALFVAIMILRPQGLLGNTEMSRDLLRGWWRRLSRRLGRPNAVAAGSDGGGRA